MKELSYHILDLVTNSLEAGAEHIEVSLSLEGNTCTLRVSDDGEGMTPEIMKSSLKEGFTTKKGNSGQGLPLINESAERTGGGIIIESAPLKGTVVTAVFMTDSPLMMPAGKIGDALSPLIPENAEIVISVKSEKGCAEINMAELKRENGCFTAYPEGIQAIRNEINKNTDIFGGSEL